MGKPTKILTAEEFDKLFNDKERFVRIAYSYVNDIEVATDITTDGFMYLWEHRDKLDIDINIKGYIYNYIRTRCISFLRKRKSMIKAHSELYRKELWRIESGINTLSNEELIDKLFESEIVEIYRRELAKMPVLTRNVFMASRLENMTYFQIAQKFNLTVRQVTSEIQRQSVASCAVERLPVGCRRHLPLLDGIGVTRPQKQAPRDVWASEGAPVCGTRCQTRQLRWASCTMYTPMRTLCPKKGIF